MATQDIRIGKDFIETPVTIGVKVSLAKNGKVLYYVGESTDNGYVYKDDEAFESGNGICYIPEWELLEYEENLKNGYTLTDEEFESFIDKLNSELSYTRDEILNLCAGSEELAKDMYYNADWAHIETYINEWVENTDADSIDFLTDKQKQLLGIE